MKVTVGGREQIASFSLAIPKTEDAWVEFPLGEWSMRFNVCIESKADLGTVTQIRCDAFPDHAKLVVQNLPSIAAMVFVDPLVVAFDEESLIVLMAHGQLINEVAVLNLGFFREKKKND